MGAGTRPLTGPASNDSWPHMQVAATPPGVRSPGMQPAVRSLWPVAALLLTTTVAAQTTRDYLYVENTLGGDISVIDLATNKVVGSIPASIVGEHPDDVIANRAGTLLFVSRLDAEDVIVISTET